MSADLDTEIRRAIDELAAAAPIAPTADELQLGRSAGMPSRRPAVAFAVLAAAVIVAGLFVVRLHDDSRRNGIGSGNASTTTSGVVPAGPTLAYGATAEQWLPIVKPHLPPGFKTVIADKSAGKATVVAVDGDAHLLEVSISDDAEFLAKQSEPPERSVDDGDFYPAGATSGWLHTRSGRLLTADGCAGGFVGAFARSPCDPVPPGTDKASLEVMLVALAHEVSLHPMEPPASAVGVMDAFVEESLRAKAAQLLTQSPISIGDPLSPTLGRYSARRGSFTFGPGTSGLFADIRVALRDRPASSDGDETIRTPSPGTIAAMYDTGSTFVLVRVAADGRGLTEDELARLRTDLSRAVRSIASAVAARLQAGPTNPAPPVGSTAAIEPATSVVDAAQCRGPVCPGDSTTTSIELSVGSYTVQVGDYLVGIAKRLAVRLDDLLAVNDLTPNSTIVPGQKLKIPVYNRPLAIDVDQRLAPLAEAFGKQVPTALVVRKVSYDSITERSMTLSAGDEGDRRQVLISVALHGDPVPALPVGVLTNAAGIRVLTWVGPSGRSYRAEAVDTEGDDAPLSIEQLVALVAALDAAS